MSEPRDERPAVDPAAVERIAARFAAADPKWHRLLEEFRRRYPKEIDDRRA